MTKKTAFFKGTAEQERARRIVEPFKRYICCEASRKCLGGCSKPAEYVIAFERKDGTLAMSSLCHEHCKALKEAAKLGGVEEEARDG